MSNYFDLLREFFVTDFKLRYKHSYLGFLWVILKPLSYYAVLYTIWTAIFGKSTDFASYLLIGILTISYFTEGVNFGLQSLFNKAHIILKVNFPREIVVLSSIAISTVNFLVNFGIYIILRVVLGNKIFTEQWYFFFIGFILLTVLLLGIAFYTSIISIKYHDIKHLIELLLQLVFWTTPIFYKLSQLPTALANLLEKGNPLVPILALIRAGLLQETEMPTTLHIVILTLAIGIFSTIGFLQFKRNIPKIAEFF